MPWPLHFWNTQLNFKVTLRRRHRLGVFFWAFYTKLCRYIVFYQQIHIQGRLSLPRCMTSSSISSSSRLSLTAQHRRIVRNALLIIYGMRYASKSPNTLRAGLCCLPARMVNTIALSELLDESLNHPELG
jgi:hypothetical protein